MVEGPRRRQDVNWVEIDGDVVAADPIARTVHVFRGAAAAVWQLIDGASLDGLDLLVADTFGVDPEVAARDIATALALLDAAGVIEVAGRSGD